MAYVFHIIEKQTWEETLKQNTQYAPETLSTDGFIHCSKPDQILDVANFLLKNKGLNNLILLKIDEQKLVSQLKYEPPFEFPMSEVHYPHIYGPLNFDAVEQTIDLPKDSQGNYKLPKIL